MLVLLVDNMCEMVLRSWCGLAQKYTLLMLTKRRGTALILHLFIEVLVNPKRKI